MKLSPHFSLQEMTKSQTALRKRIDNTPDNNQLQCLTDLCTYILEPVREEFGALTPSSAFRCAELNEAIGSSLQSQHGKGQAADIEVMGVDNFELASWITDNLSFDQLILEFYKDGEPNAGWVHCSYVSGSDNRQEVLRYDGKAYRKGLE
jgi:zinc D-Ala-D-Ala carboxypeptidase|tara:strand:- start:1972 stop:2421 length:450 start_codon:yes stop_codon:yes gene_type:complete